MPLDTQRLDKFLSQQLSLNQHDVRLLLARNLVQVDGQVVSQRAQRINRFSRIEVEGTVLQANTPYYYMLNKPDGVVSATVDAQHPTALDLLTVPHKAELHIAGRLDLHSTGLLLFTNDSRWSEALAHPDNKIAKHYRVDVAKPLDEGYVQAFAEGMHFPFEDIVTQPAKLQIASEYQADVWLKEGKYHQIKRMFGRFRNPVTALHRLSIGEIVLDVELAPGQSRALTQDEVNSVHGIG